MLLNLFFTIVLSCALDQSFTQEPIVTKAPTRELLVQAVSSSPVQVQFGCPLVESFWIESIGEQAITITDITILVSMETEATLVNPLPILPLLLLPEESFTIDLALETANDREDTVMVSVVSNDPDSPNIATVLLQPDTLSKVTDTFTVTAGQEIDLLLVIDNSCSMFLEQRKLIDNAAHIINGLDAYSSDYHIGVITTDNPSFIGDHIVQSNTDPISDLSLQMDVSILGSSIETGIKSAIESTSVGGDAAPTSLFFRDEARLAIVWISDEDDQSTGTISDWTTHFWNLKISPSDVIGWSIVTDTTANCPEAVPGTDYIDLANTLGGGWTQICEQDWQPTFENLAAEAGTISTFKLSNIPFIPSLEVQVNGTLSYNWVYVVDSNAVSFNPGSIPKIGSTIKITYGISVCD